MPRELFLETFWYSATILLMLLVVVAFKFAFIYLTAGRKAPPAAPRVAEPEAYHPDVDARMDELEEVLRMPVKVERVSPQPVKVQPKARAVEVLPVTSIECAKCNKQIKSPPVSQKPTQYKCEHCGTTVALAS